MSENSLQDFIAERLRDVRTRMSAACKRVERSPEDVTLVAVTKTHPLPQVQALYQLGENIFAENRVQDARKRIPELPRDITWHYIGPLQTNKAKYFPGLFSWVHSVDRIEAAEALNKVFTKHENVPPLRVLLQFNVAEESQKHGAGAEEAMELARYAFDCPRLKVEGLMCMAPYADDPETARPYFRQLRELRDELQKRLNKPLPHLSMGMTGDFEVAIEEGATIVRVGTALFE